MVVAQHGKPKKQIYEWRIDLKDSTGTVLVPGDVVGFDVVVLDADGEGRRDFSRMKWGGSRHERDRFGGRRSNRRGDLLLMDRGQALGALSGTVAWRHSADQEPPQAAAVSAFGKTWHMNLASDAQGRYSALVPSGRYQVAAVDFRMADSAAVHVEVRTDVSSEAPPLVVERDLPANYYRSAKANRGDGRHRGMSWVAGNRPLSEYDLLPLVKNGINWIAQTPFGWQRTYDSSAITLRPDAGPWGEQDLGISETAALARKFGIRTLLKPHLWLRRSDDGKWRADIEMADEQGWQAWFADYRAFMLHYARLAQASGIEALCIGTELHKPAVEREADWRALIADIRQVYHGQLTYAANWYIEFEEIAFGDALDFIGIQAYFPLTQDKDPSAEQLLAGWQQHLVAIERVQQQYGKPVLVTELGYHSAAAAAVRPWEWRASAEENDYEAGRRTQANAYEAFYQAFWDKAWFAGVYFWKWYPQYENSGGPYDRDFTPQNKPAEQVMRHFFMRAASSGAMP